MANRIEYQELADLDGFRKVISDARADYKAFSDEVVKFNGQMQRSIQAAKDDLERMRKAVAGTDNVEALQQMGQRAVTLRTQINEQTAATEALKKVEQQHAAVTQSLSGRLETLLTEYSKLEGSTARVVAQKKRLAAEMAQLSNQLDRLAKANNASANGAKEVAGQYNRLQKELADARKELRALDNAFDSNTGKLNRSNTEAVRLATKISVADKALRTMDQTLKVHSRNIGNYESALQGLASGGFTGLVGSLGLLGVALTAVINIGDKALETIQDIERFDAGLMASSRDAADYARSQQFLIALADQLGVKYRSLINDYKSLKAATKDTALEGRATEEIFAAVATAGAKLGLTNEDVSGTLRALTQMISKGKISAEELRQQLGERLPSAIRLMSEALGISESELNKMMEQGRLMAVEVLPKFAKELDEAYGLKQGEKVERLGASVNRLKNEQLYLLKAFADDSGVTQFFGSIVDGFTRSLRNVRLFMQDGSWKEFLIFFGPNSLAARTARSIAKEDAVARFIGLDANARKAEIDRLKKLEEEQNKSGSEERYTTREVRRRLQDEDMRARAREIQDKRRQEAAAEKSSIEKNEADLTRFQKQAVRKRTAEIIELEKQLARDPNNSYVKEKLDVYKRLDAEQKAKDKEVATRLFQGSEAAKEKAQRERDRQLQEAIKNIRADAGVQVSGLDTAKSAGMNEVEYLNRRLAIQQDAVLKEQELLRSAGKQNTDEYKATQQALNDIAAEYIEKRNKIEGDAFKNAYDAVKSAIESEASEMGGQLTQRLADIQVAFTDKETEIKQAVASRQITESEGEQRLFDLKIQLLKDIAAATADNSARIQKMAQDRLDEVASKLRAEGKTEIEIAKALEDERKRLQRERLDSEKAGADARVKIAETESEKKQRLLQKEKDLKKRLEDAYWEAASVAMNNYFDVAAAFRQQDTDALEKAKEHDLKMAGDNEDAKAAIEKRYADQSLELKRRQARADKAQAAFNVILSTTESIMKTYAEFGFPAGTPLALVMGAIGALNLGAILAKPLPEFFKGTKDAPEGPAWVGERGYELIESKQNGKPTYRLAAEKQVAYLNKHDRVYTHEETKRILQVNKELAHEVRTAPGGSMYSPPVVVNNGFSEDAMERAMLKALSSQTVQETHLTEDGLKRYARKTNQRTEWLNQHFSLPRKKG